MPTPSFFTADTEEEWLQTAKEDVLFSIREALSKAETCRIGLAGGSTPRALYKALADENLPWEKLQFILIDERQVPSDHSESNLRMIRESLFNQAPIPPENILAFDAALNPDSAAKDMSRKLIELTTERFPLFDLLILGAGPDGHIASLFENSPALQSGDYATPNHVPGQKIEDRLTLTQIALKSTGQALLLLKGKSKQAVYDSFQEGRGLPLTALRELSEDVPVKTLAYLEGR